MARSEEIARRRIEQAAASGAATLDLTALGLTHVPSELRGLDSLEDLYLNDNLLTEIPSWLADVPRLSCLQVSNNQLTSLPEAFAASDMLRALGLSGNPFTELPEWISRLGRLDALRIGNHRFTEPPDWIGRLRSLKQLSIVQSGLTAIPAWLEELASLKELYLEGNRLTLLPEWLSSFTELTRLDIGYNLFRELPDWIGELANLSWLAMSRNPLTRFPDAVAGLRQLETLLASTDHLTELPDWIGDLDKLTGLMIGGYRLKQLPEWLAGLTRLAMLGLSENELTTIPEWLGQLTQLQSLSFWTNDLIELPDALGALTRLTSLNVKHNRLTRLPDWIGERTALTELIASENLISILPDSIGRLAALARLDVSENRLTALPDWLVDLPELVDLTVHGNPLLSPPPEITATGAASTLEFLQARRLGSAQQWSSKMLVVGEGGVGKTSAIKALLGERFDKSEETTHGLRIHTYRVGHPRLAGTWMQLNTWDFGGQQIYHATHQFFLTNRSLFLLLWNNRLGWEQGRLRYWLDIIAARAPESPILLVATNAPAGGRPVDLPLDDLRRDYPQITDSIAIDNETSDGIDTLRAAITDLAEALPLMGSEWPKTWLTAADTIRGFQAKHIDPNQMWRAMAQSGLHDERHQRYVAAALHQLGDILYYEDDPELADTVILRPEWVNEYISVVLDSPDVERSQGLLTREQLNSLWTDLDRGMRDHFVRMMDKYDLCYQVEGGRSREVSLVVERLPWNAPPYRQQWDRADPDRPEHEIRVIYQLNTIPPGIPTWFIARSHRFSTGIHWRTGALLAHPDGRHRALIRTDTHRNQVDIAVRGPGPAAFFAVLDDGLNLTLGRYPGLSIKRMVPCPCATEAGESCDELYDFDDLLARLNRVPPRHDVECRKTGRDINVPFLLLGLAPCERDELRTSLERLEKTVSAQHDDLAHRFKDLSGDMQRQFLKVQQHIQAALETRCPSVFAILPIKHSRVTGASFELRLYCEEPGAWHPLPGELGCYQANESPVWLQRIGPYLQGLVGVLKHAAPLAGPVLGIAVDKLAERTKAEVDAMAELVAQLPPLVDFGERFGRPSTPRTMERATLEADFRALENLLVKLDPERRWGGLSRITTPEGLALYLCPDHAAPYQRALPTS